MSQQGPNPWGQPPPQQWPPPQQFPGGPPPGGPNPYPGGPPGAPPQYPGGGHRPIRWDLRVPRRRSPADRLAVAHRFRRRA